MHPNPACSGCGCALFLAGWAVYFAWTSAWAFAQETGLLYPCVAGLVVWIVVALARWTRRRWSDVG
jgi:hypothetical protein